MGDPLFERLAILGLGLIGGSFALAAGERGLARTIVAFDPNLRHLAEASEAGIIEQGFSRARDAVEGADGVILAAPVRAILTLLPTLAPWLREGAFVMDLGSTKRAIVAAMEGLPVGVGAVGGHPMAGKEVAGFGAAEPTLFINATFALCATSRTTAVARAQAEEVVALVGARALWVEAAAHDDAVARVSHLPYLLASVLARAAAPAGLARQLAATGYRDTSRLAGSDPAMMLDILLTNPEAILAALRDSRAALEGVEALLAARDEGGLRAWMERSRGER